MATLKDVFGELIDDSFLAVSEGEVLGMDISRENAEVLMTAKYGKLLDRSVILDFERHIVQAMELKSFRLFPKYTPDMLCAEYFPQLVERLKTTAKVVNGYFDGAEASFADGVCTINLKNGGARVFVKFGHFQREYRYLPLRALYLLALAGEGIEPLSVYPNGGIHRRSLQYISHEFREYIYNFII